MSEVSGICEKCHQHITVTRAGTCPRCGVKLVVFKCTQCGHIALTPGPDRRCPKCSAPLPGTAACRKCGHPLVSSEMSCPQCGTPRLKMVALLGFFTLACVGSSVVVFAPWTELGVWRWVLMSVGLLFGAVLLIFTITLLVQLRGVRRAARQ